MELVFKEKEAICQEDPSVYYDVDLVGGKTVADLVDLILKEKMHWIGEIIIDFSDYFSGCHVEFENGKITKSVAGDISKLAAEEVLEIRLRKVYCRGTYHVKLKRSILFSEDEISSHGTGAENASDHSEAEKVPAKNDPDLAAEMGVLVKRFEAVVEALQAAQAAMTVFGRIQNIVSPYAEKDRDKTDKQ